jgi:hypothetical protein
MSLKNKATYMGAALVHDEPFRLRGIGWRMRSAMLIPFDPFSRHFPNATPVERFRWAVSYLGHYFHRYKAYWPDWLREHGDTMPPPRIPDELRKAYLAALGEVLGLAGEVLPLFKQTTDRAAFDASAVIEFIHGAEQMSPSLEELQPRCLAALDNLDLHMGTPAKEILSRRSGMLLNRRDDENIEAILKVFRQNPLRKRFFDDIRLALKGEVGEHTITRLLAVLVSESRLLHPTKRSGYSLPAKTAS